MKNKWSNYALKDGKIQSSYIRQYSNRSPKREAAKTGCGNCFQQGWQKQTKEKVDLTTSKSDHQKVIVNPMITKDDWIVNLRNLDERIGKENIVETHQQGLKGIQVPIEGRSTIEEENFSQTKSEEMKKDKQSPKAHKKHEASESKAYEKKEDKKEKSAKKK